MVIRKQVSVVLSNGQTRTHALYFDDDGAYIDWIKDIGTHLMVSAKGTVNLDHPYAIYKFQEIIGMEFSDLPEEKPPIGFTPAAGMTKRG